MTTVQSVSMWAYRIYRTTGELVEWGLHDTWGPDAYLGWADGGFNEVVAATAGEEIEPIVKAVVVHVVAGSLAELTENQLKEALAASGDAAIEAGESWRVNEIQHLRGRLSAELAGRELRAPLP